MPIVKKIRGINLKYAPPPQGKTIRGEVIGLLGFIGLVELLGFVGFIGSTAFFGRRRVFGDRESYESEALAAQSLPDEYLNAQ